MSATIDYNEPITAEEEASEEWDELNLKNLAYYILNQEN